MSLSEKVLKSINDTQPIFMHADRSAALKTFLGTYEEQTKLDGTLPTLMATTTGRELKDAFDMLEVDVQLTMLTAYWNTVHGKTIETVAAIKERELKHFMTKFGVVTICATLIAVVAGVIVMVSKGGTVDNSVLKSILSTAGDILKVILGTSGSK